MSKIFIYNEESKAEVFAYDHENDVVYLPTAAHPSGGVGGFFCSGHDGVRTLVVKNKKGKPKCFLVSADWLIKEYEDFYHKSDKEKCLEILRNRRDWCKNGAIAYEEKNGEAHGV